MTASSSIHEDLEAKTYHGKALIPPIKKGLKLYETRLDGNAVWVKVDPLF